MHARLLWVVGVLAVVLGGFAVPAEIAAAAPTTDASTWATATVPLANGAIAFDAVRQKVLVGVAPSVPALGNKLVELDPLTGALGRSVVVGSSPSVIAVADDASRAYVGFSGAPIVTEVDLTAFTVTRTITLGSSLYLGSYYAEDIEVQPGHPEVFAVSRRNHGFSPRHEGVAVYDAGVRRTNTTANHTGANRIAFGTDPGILYGANNETSGGEFYNFAIDANGIAVTSATSSLSGGDLEFGDGLLHTVSGRVIDPVAKVQVGMYPTNGYLALDLTHHKAFMLNGGTLSRLDMATRLSDWSTNVPNVGATDLIDTGSGLAAGGGDYVLLLGPGVSKSGYLAPTGPPSRVHASHAVTTDLAVSALAAAPDGAHVYGVVGSAAATRPNQLVEIDAATGAVGRFLTVGADPNAIAISADGSTLMISHDDANILTQVDVGTFTVEHTVTLAADEWGSDIAARPGHPLQFAVVLNNHCCSPRLEGQILVKDGVILPKRGPGHTGATSITFTGDPDKLYGHNGGTSDNGFYTLGVSDAGLTPISSVMSFGVSGLTSSNGIVYGRDGQIADPTGPAKLGSVAASGIPVPVPAENRLLMAANNEVREYLLDATSFVASTPIPTSGMADAVLVGSRLAIAGTTKVFLVPLGIDTHVPPDAPTGVGGVGSDGKVHVTWIAPPEIPGAPVLSYTVTAVPGGQTCTTADEACFITGLVNGRGYQFQVVANNTYGASPPSALSPWAWPTRCGLGGPGPYPDVPENDPFCISIEWMTGYGMATGYGDGFHGASPVSRQAFSAFIYRYAGKPAFSLPPFPSFTDVGPDHPFAKDIEWMAWYGFVHGYADGSFRPTTNVSRQSLAVVMYRMAGSPGFTPPSTPTFSDITTSHPFYKEIEWLAAKGIGHGYSDGTYRGMAPVSRQAMTFFIMMFNANVA